MWFLALSALVIAASDLAVASSRADAPDDLDFRAGYAVHGNGTWATEIYIRRVDAAASEWVARRSLVTPEGREQVAWTSSSSCPVLDDVAYSLNHLPLGELVMPELNRSGPRKFVYPAPGRLLHGAGFTIWGRGMSGEGFVDYQLRAQTGNVADWARGADQALEPCWDPR
jgi:hypothetical protein